MHPVIVHAHLLYVNEAKKKIYDIRLFHVPD